MKVIENALVTMLCWLVIVIYFLFCTIGAVLCSIFYALPLDIYARLYLASSFKEGIKKLYDDYSSFLDNLFDKLD